MAPVRHYLVYLRPRSFVVTTIFVATGYALSPARPDSVLSQLHDLIWLHAVYSILLWGGANALNSAEDRDVGPVNLLPNPPPLPTGLGAFGIAWSALAIPIAASRGWRPALIVTIGFVCSVFYSRHLPWRFPRGKEIPGVDVLINAAGCGLGAVLLGFVATPALLNVEVFLVGIAFTVCIWGGIPTSQIFQLSPAGNPTMDRNYTTWLGPRLVLRLGPAFFLTHLFLLTLHAALWRPRLFDSSLSLALWLAWVVLVLGASVHSLVWSRAPFERSHARMLRQLAMLMASQTCWMASIWFS